MKGKNGETYRPKVPRDTCLPAEESINCHCVMEAVKDDRALGMSKEELARLREQALDEVDAEWALDHQSDKINIILGMEKSD